MVEAQGDPSRRVPRHFGSLRFASFFLSVIVVRNRVAVRLPVGLRGNRGKNSETLPASDPSRAGLWVGGLWAS